MDFGLNGADRRTERQTYTINCNAGLSR